MKKSKMKIVLLGLLGLLFLFVSCTKDFSTLNQDPNNPTDVPAINILTNALLNGIERELGGWENHTYLGPWSQQIAKIQYIDEDRYLVRSSNGYFNAPYTSELMDLQLVIDKVQGDAAFESLEGVARIMKAYFFQRHTDLFGDIPYSEALRADEELLLPKYDTQQSIYTDLIAELKAGRDLVAASTDGQLAKGDPIYGGDTVAWELFANSILLRLYMRMSGADAATAQAGIEAIVAGGDYFASNADNATMAVTGAKPYRNGLFETLETRTDQGCSRTMINLLNGKSDPRLPIYAQDIDDDYGKGSYDGPDDVFVGQINGDLGPGPNQSTVSLLGVPVAYDAARPYKVFDYADVCFILAEAALNGWSVGGTAQSYYEDGITASMNQWSALAQSSPMAEFADASEITAAEIATYLAGDSVAYDAAKAKEQICTQRWMAMYVNGIQGWSLNRRTGYPVAIEKYELPATAFPGLGVPLRFPYCDDEAALNSVNLAVAAAGITNTMYGKPVWWDTRTTKASGAARLGI